MGIVCVRALEADLVGDFADLLGALALIGSDHPRPGLDRRLPFCDGSPHVVPGHEPEAHAEHGDAADRPQQHAAGSPSRSALAAAQLLTHVLDVTHSRPAIPLALLTGPSARAGLAGAA